MPETASHKSVDPHQWLREHGDYLFGYAMKRVRNADVAEELVQETLVVAVERIDTFAGRSALRTWLVGILKKKLLQHIRQATRDELQHELTSQLIEDQFSGRGKWKQTPARWGTDPALGAENEEFRVALANCLEKLPPRSAEAFRLTELERLDAENLARLLQVSVANLYVLLYRARSALRSCLERSWFGGERGGETRRSGC